MPSGESSKSVTAALAGALPGVPVGGVPAYERVGRGDSRVGTSRPSIGTLNRRREMEEPSSASV